MSNLKLDGCSRIEDKNLLTDKCGGGTTERFELIQDFEDWCGEEEESMIDWESTVTCPTYLVSKLIIKFDNEYQKFHNKLDDDKYTLNTVTTVAVCVLLEEILDKLTILECIQDLPEIEKVIEYKTLEERFGEKQLEKDYMMNLNQKEEVSMEKLAFQINRTYFEVLLGRLFDELVKNNSYQPLVYHIIQRELQLYQERKLVTIEMKNKYYLRNLLFTLEYQKTLAEYNLLVTKENVEVVCDHFEDEKLLNNINGRYIDNWENARAEQNAHRIITEEQRLNETIDSQQKKMEREERVHSEIARALLTLTELMKIDIETWTKKYNNDMESKEMEISMLKEMREEQFEKLKELQELYLLHQTEIEDYLALKARRLLEIETKARRHMAAWKIQRWWRRWYAWKHRKKHKMNLKDVKKLRKKLKEKLHQ